MNKAMNASILPIDDESLERAKRILLNDGLVAFPTETVYGLGANALSDGAIRAVYAAKGRPSDNPLIVHVHPSFDVQKLVYDNDIAKKLRKAFLPGPLTLVYKSKGVVSSFVSCGLDTLALRVPSDGGARKFLEYVGIPIAAPSANLSKHTSPVTAEHVYNDFADKIELILDGGRCSGGIESTVIDVTGETPVILRKGLVTAADVKSVIGRCEYAAENSALNERSPGTKYRHYCPNTETALFERSELEVAEALYERCAESGKTPFFMCDEIIAQKLRGKFNVLNLGADGRQMASRLYFLLHEGERLADVIIAVKLEPSDEVTMSVNNRFLKAFAGSK